MSEIDGRTVRSAQRRKPGKRSWTKRKRTTFLRVLAETCNVQAAAREADIGAGAAYYLRLRDAEFAQLWAAAMDTGYVRLEAALLQRALGKSEAGKPAAGEPSDNPSLAEVVATDGRPPAELDVDLAFKLLQRRRGDDHGGRAGGGPSLRQPNPVEIFRALERKVIAIEKKVERQHDR